MSSTLQDLFFSRAHYAEIAKEFLCRQQSVIDFFDAVVDINSNKLVLAVSTYIQNGSCAVQRTCIL